MLSAFNLADSKNDEHPITLAVAYICRTAVICTLGVLSAFVVIKVSKPFYHGDTEKHGELRGT
jgi:hypothetical protein